MGLFSKLRLDRGPAPQRTSGAEAKSSMAATATVQNTRDVQKRTEAAPHSGRISNGLKEFLSQLDGIGRGHLLDLGSARQTTINFFIERGFKVYSDDLLMTWKRFSDEEDQHALEIVGEAERPDPSPTARAERFLQSTLQYPKDTFDAVLVWDLLDYVDAELVSRLVARLTTLLRDGGVILAIFHTRKPETFHRYRVIDAQNLELMPTPGPFSPQRVYQNREISNLFSRFRSSRTFVGRDQYREGLFVK